ncbi:Protein CBG02707 [Caenorhabditis briggsae]|uniref:Protein CBG02707 n=1 Tax=Caenorhabditis briggsae TaxID=6238 RepID=A8WTP5_CAEBR|nr:Protein CBG02707 [Caenorhabditis briggsae]CAP23857.2 Protein CBG02707 [Caenorhabditis briggsae]
MFASYIDDTFKLRLLPIGFIPSTDSKTGADTADAIIDRLQSVGWSEEEARACSITADGALANLGTYFSSYIRCVSHSIHLLGEKVVDPLEKHAKMLDPEIMKLLPIARECLDNAQNVSSAIRNNFQACSEMSRLPTLPNDTRWLNGLKCLVDVTELSKEILDLVSKLSLKGRTSMYWLNDHPEYDNAVLHILKPLLTYSIDFQKDRDFTKIVDKDIVDLDLIEAMATSGLKPLQHYYSQFGTHHYGATLLSPRTKHMKNFTKEERKRAAPPNESSTTHSYTVLPLISASGKLHPKLFVTLKESKGQFPQKGHFQASNLEVTCHTSHIMTKELMKVFFQKIVFDSSMPNDALFIVDSWNSWKDTAAIDSVTPSSHKLKLLTIPAGCTGRIQPCDVGIFGSFKKVVKTLTNYAQLTNSNYKFQTRDETLKLLSLVWRQLCSPKLEKWARYAWVAAGYDVPRPASFETPAQLLFPRGVAGDCTMHGCSSTSYLDESFNVKSSEKIEEYWSRKRLDYPALYTVATKVLSIVPSESVCETTFSTAAFLLDKRRTRLRTETVEKIVVGSQIASKNPDWVDDLKTN